MTASTSVRPISEQERRAGLRYGLWDSAFVTVMVQVVMGTFVIGLALLLGANEIQVGLLAALPAVANLVQPIGAYFVERRGNRKRMGLVLFSAARMAWLPIVLLPLLGYDGGQSSRALWLLIGVCGVSSLINAFAGVSWWSWMSDLVPEAIRGDYFARRTVVSALVGIVCSIAFGAFADVWKARFGAQDAGGFLLLFAIAVAFGVLSVMALERTPDVPLRRTAETPRWGEAVQDALSNPNFRALIVAGSSWGFWVMFSSPFYVVYMLEDLHLSYGAINIFAAIASLGNVIFARFIGRLSDHFGNRPVQLACMIGTGILPFMYLFCAGGSWYIIPVAHLVGGVTWAGYTVANMNQVMKITPEENKSVYLGVYNAATGLAFAVGPIVGGLFADALKHFNWQIGTATFINLHLVMFVSGVGRLASIQLMRRVKESRARTFWRMLQVLRRVPALNPLVGLTHTWEGAIQIAAAVGRRVKGTDDTARYG